MFEYRHNKCVGHTPLRSYSPFLSTAKTYGNKKDVGVSFSPRLSLLSGSSIAP